MNVDLERAASWISDHPWPGIGLAFLGGVALGIAESLPLIRPLVRGTFAAVTGTAIAVLRDETLQSWTDYRARSVGQASVGQA